MPRQMARPAYQYNKVVVQNSTEVHRAASSCHSSRSEAYTSDSNQVHNSAGVQVRQLAMENETFKIGDADHEFLLEEAINRNVLDMEYDDEFESESLSGEEDESAHPDDIDEDESEEEDEGSEVE